MCENDHVEGLMWKWIHLESGVIPLRYNIRGIYDNLYTVILCQSSNNKFRILLTQLESL